jgi:glutamyl-Q tRNA(Asp) synthetase
MHSLCTGRFAPSPSGELHFGSLIAALGSYLSARSAGGQWLVRIDDLDPPREIAGAATTILRQLEHYGLFWDQSVLWQSQRQPAYLEIIDTLLRQKQVYLCTCSRQTIKGMGGWYNGHCRSQNASHQQAALRLFQQQPVLSFTDRLRGTVSCSPPLANEDFIVRRRDGLIAYNLAVVVDDHYQGVTEVVRGADLIEPTVRQVSLYQLLGWEVPSYLHLPLVVNSAGNKLSKQNHAPPLTLGDPRPVIIRALSVLGQTTPLGWQDLTCEQLLQEAIKRWQPLKIPVEPYLMATEHEFRSQTDDTRL